MKKIRQNISNLLTGKLIRLREVEAELDSSLMIDLRSNPSLTKYLPAIDSDLEKQNNWIASLEGNNNDFMFAVETKTKKKTEGYLGVYSILNKEAEWGRWVMREASPASLESVLLLHRFAFEGLKLERLFCRTVVNNQKVLSFHDKYGAVRTRVIKNSIVINGQDFDLQEHEITYSMWCEISNKFRFLLN